MKILIYSSKFPPAIGGVENVTYNLAKNFKSAGNDVLVISSYIFENWDQPTLGWSHIDALLKGFLVITPKENVKGVSIVRSFMSLPRSFMGYLSFPYRFIASILKTRSAITKYNPEVINFHFADDSLYYFYLITSFLKYPIITNVHGNELHLFSKNPIYRFFFNLLLKRSTKIIVNSNYMLGVFTEKYPNHISKTIIINNGIDLHKFKNTESPGIDYKKDSYYLFVGRLDYKKGIDILIDVFNDVQDSVSKKLLIIGGSKGEKSHGSLSISDYRKLVKNTDIEFLGWIDPEHLATYFKNAYACIFPSRNEPFGIVALESFAYGTPVIASSGGFKEILEKSEAGIYFEPEDKTALKKAIIKFDSDSKMVDTFSEKALKFVKSYDWNQISNKYLNTFKNV